MSKDVHVSPAETGRQVGVSRQTLRHWREKRINLPFIRVSARRIFYRQSDIDRFLASRFVSVDE